MLAATATATATTATYVVSLPPSMPSHAALRDVHPRPSSTLLLGERDPEMRALLAYVLRREGHQVVGVADGSALLEALAARLLASSGQADRTADFDCIVSAQDLPGVPGLAVLAGLRARGRRTPFVLMTSDPAIQAHARRLGAVILDGPLHLRSIRGAIHQASLAAVRVSPS